MTLAESEGIERLRQAINLNLSCMRYLRFQKLKFQRGTQDLAQATFPFPHCVSWFL